MNAIVGTARAAGVEERLFLGLPTWIKADGFSTDGRLSLIEQVIPAGFESPWHVHHTEDESFYVIDGLITVIVEDDRTELGRGDFAFGPRGRAHGFRVGGNQPARILLMTTGGDFAAFISETSTNPNTAPAAPDMGKLVAAAERNGIGILGPLPQ